MAELSAKDREFMGVALALARKNATTAEDGPFGAVVVHDGRVVGEGRNQVMATNYPSAHAEIVQELAKHRSERRLTTVQLKTEHENPFAVWLANPNRVPY